MSQRNLLSESNIFTILLDSLLACVHLGRLGVQGWRQRRWRERWETCCSWALPCRRSALPPPPSCCRCSPHRQVRVDQINDSKIHNSVLACRGIILLLLHDDLLRGSSFSYLWPSLCLDLSFPLFRKSSQIPYDKNGRNHSIQCRHDASRTPPTHAIRFSVQWQT